MAMRNKIMMLLFVVAALMVSGEALAATLSWTAPATYTDGTAIPAAKIATITYKTYTGSASTGPWTAGSTTGAGALSATVPEPAPGTTMWYTIDCTLDGQVSGKAAAVSKISPYKNPNPPANLWIQ
jgi:hypothetical protein